MLTLSLIASSPLLEAADPGARLGRLSCEAGEVAKYDGSLWVCSADNAGFVLRDGNGEVIGPIIGIENDPLNMIVPLRFHSPELDEHFATRLTFRYLDDNQFASSAVVSFFEEDACAGEPWFTSVGIQMDFFVPTVVTRSNLDGRLQLRFLHPGEAVVIASHSRIIDENTFECVSTARDLTPVTRGELVVDDYLATFPPPYSIDW